MSEECSSHHPGPVSQECPQVSGIRKQQLPVTVTYVLILPEVYMSYTEHVHGHRSMRHMNVLFL